MMRMPLILWRLDNYFKMMKLSSVLKPKYLIILICALFLFTRIYKIDQIPPSLYWDEASIGYNAYSISRTGKDEWDDFLPIHFRAFGEFKLPIYIYSTVPFIKIFGLNELSVRIPSVLFSLGIVIVSFLLGRKITGSTAIGLWSSFFMSISPWLFIFSRTGFEATTGLTFYLLGIYFFFKRSNKLFFLASIISLILSAYSYNSFRMLSLTLAQAFFIRMLFQKHNTKKVLIVTWVAILLYLLSVIPIIRLFIYDAGFGRTQAFTLFPAIQQVYDLSGKPHFQLIFDRSKSTDWSKNLTIFLKNLFSHLSPSFLLLTGDGNNRNQQSGFGQLYIIDLVLISLGIFYLIKSKRIKEKRILLIIFLFILGLVPASLFKESPHALRSLGSLPFLILISSFGVVYMTSKYSKLSTLIVIIYLLFFTNYYQSFLTSYPKNTSSDWQYGYKAIFTEYKDIFKNYDQIIISDSYAQPYIFGLYYLQYDPKLYLSTVQYNPVSEWGFSKVAKFDKFEFQKEENLKIIGDGKVLLFTTKKQEKLSKNLKSVIVNLDGKESFWVYQI